MQGRVGQHHLQRGDVLQGKKSGCSGCADTLEIRAHSLSCWEVHTAVDGTKALRTLNKGSVAEPHIGPHSVSLCTSIKVIVKRTR